MSLWAFVHKFLGVPPCSYFQKAEVFARRVGPTLCNQVKSGRNSPVALIPSLLAQLAKDHCYRNNENVDKLQPKH
eukprot:6478054-Amphidinium_carterae.1